MASAILESSSAPGMRGLALVSPDGHLRQRGRGCWCGCCPSLVIRRD